MQASLGARPPVVCPTLGLGPRDTGQPRCAGTGAGSQQARGSSGAICTGRASRGPGLRWRPPSGVLKALMAKGLRGGSSAVHTLPPQVR